MRTVVLHLFLCIGVAVAQTCNQLNQIEEYCDDICAPENLPPCDICAMTTITCGEYCPQGTFANGTVCSDLRCNEYGRPILLNHSCGDVCPDNHQANGTLCAPCPAGTTAENGQPCRNFAEEELKQETKPTTKNSIATRIRQTQFSSKTTVKRKQFRSMIQSLKEQIRAIEKSRIQLRKEELVLSNKFKEKLGTRTVLDVIVPKQKTTAKMNSIDACDEKDVDLKTQPLAYEVSLEETEAALVCSGNTPVTKLTMTNEGTTTDSFTYACWENNAWTTETEILSGQDYLCEGKAFYVNSLSGVTCNVSNPVSSLDPNVEAGVTGVDCGETLGDGETCSATCNPNFVLSQEANCTAEGFQPAVCHCPQGFTDNLDGTCTATATDSCTVTKPISALDNNIIAGNNVDCAETIAAGQQCTAECNENYVKLSDGICTTEGYQPAQCICNITGFHEDGTGNCKSCDAGLFLNSNSTCVPWTVTAQECNALNKPFVAGDHQTDASCAETCAGGLTAEGNRCIDPLAKIQCHALSWLYDEGLCCENQNNKPSCVYTLDRQATVRLNSFGNLKRADGSACQDTDQITYQQGILICT